MGVLDHGQGQSRERVTECWLGRNDCDHRMKTGVQETARGFPNE
jgi:hypothetical protein